MALLADAAKLAIESAMAVSGVRVQCCPLDKKIEIDVGVAALGAVTQVSEGTNGQMVRLDISDARSLLVWPHDLVIGDYCHRPIQGDMWSIWLPNGKRIYAECAAFDPEPAWRWTDRFETAYRIHVKVMDYHE